MLIKMPIVGQTDNRELRGIRPNLGMKKKMVGDVAA